MYIDTGLVMRINVNDVYIKPLLSLSTLSPSQVISFRISNLSAWCNIFATISIVNDSLDHTLVKYSLHYTM